MTLYALIGRFLHWLAGPLLAVLYGPKRYRSRILILNPQREVLLVRSWFGYQQWSLPGGGIGKHESPKGAAMREAQEETGVAILPQTCWKLGEFPNGDSRALFTVDCWVAELAKVQDAHLPLNRWYEILGVGWFPLNNLPKNCSSTVIQAIDLFVDKKTDAP